MIVTGSCPICGLDCEIIPHPVDPNETIYECQIAWRPQEGPQTEFCSSDIFEVFFGGAAGGGKSDALLMEGLRQCDISTYRAILFRKTYAQLRELEIRSRHVFPKAYEGARFNISDHTWRFPSGASYQFSHLEDEKALENHDA